MQRLGRSIPGNRVAGDGSTFYQAVYRFGINHFLRDANRIEQAKAAKAINAIKINKFQFLEGCNSQIEDGKDIEALQDFVLRSSGSAKALRCFLWCRKSDSAWTLRESLGIFGTGKLVGHSISWFPFESILIQTGCFQWNDNFLQHPSDDLRFQRWSWTGRVYPVDIQIVLESRAPQAVWFRASWVWWEIKNMSLQFVTTSGWYHASNWDETLMSCRNMSIMEHDRTW